MLQRRTLTGIAVVVDLAVLARSRPVAARVLADRLGRPARHLEALLQDLVRHGFLKGTRGPRGGYQLARERRRITLGEIVRRLGSDPSPEARPTPARIVEDVVLPALAGADAAYLERLDQVSVQDLTDAIEAGRTARGDAALAEFHI